ncbi:cytochrome P450 [Mycolicibacterium anyangense]|jgi:cytochrome P450|nr:cytochrome P450 [Mycolicibacterium anyangense]
MTSGELMDTAKEPFDFRLSEYARVTDALTHPQPYLAEKVATTRFERIEEGVVYLYRHEDIIKVNRDPRILGVGGRGSAFGAPSPLIPLEIDGADHVKWRKLMDPLFAPKQVAKLEDSIRALTAELVDQFAAQDVVEMYTQFCVPLPCLTFLRLFGAPAEDLPFFLSYTENMLRPAGDTAEEKKEAMVGAAGQLIAYFHDLLAKRRAESPKDDVLGTLMAVEIDGAPVSDEELLNVIMLLMFAGLDTVTSSVSLMIDWLARNPEQRQRVVSDPSLLRGFVEEMLRYESPVPIGTRYPTEDVDLGDGLVLKAGEAVVASWATANLDPAVHTDPLTVNIDRPRHMHIAFASGTHRCLGSNLARMELRVALEELHKRMPNYSIAPDDEVRYANVPVRAAEYLPLVIH